MAKEQVWLTEQEIGDYFWKNWDEYFGEKDTEVYRELSIGSLRPDFITFQAGKEERIKRSSTLYKSVHRIKIYELKITANLGACRG